MFNTGVSTVCSLDHASLNAWQQSVEEAVTTWEHREALYLKQRKASLLQFLIKPHKSQCSISNLFLPPFSAAYYEKTKPIKATSTTDSQFFNHDIKQHRRKVNIRQRIGPISKKPTSRLHGSRATNTTPKQDPSRLLHPRSRPTDPKPTLRSRVIDNAERNHKRAPHSSTPQSPPLSTDPPRVPTKVGQKPQSLSRAQKKICIFKWQTLWTYGFTSNNRATIPAPQRGQLDMDIERKDHSSTFVSSAP